MDKKFEGVNLIKVMMIVKVNRSGRRGYSKFITIPKSYVRKLGWRFGDLLQFEQCGDTITISRTDQVSRNVRRLRLSGYSYVVTIPKKIAEKVDSDQVKIEIVGDKLAVRICP